MTDEQKAALAWLDKVIEGNRKAFGALDERTRASLTIRGMLMKHVWQVRWVSPEGYRGETTFDSNQESALTFALDRLRTGCQGVGIVQDEVPHG